MGQVAAFDMVIQCFEGPGQMGVGQGCVLGEDFLSFGILRRSEKFRQLLSIHD